MKIENENSYVEFKLTDSFEEHVACCVEVYCDGFSGKVYEVWFSYSDYRDFVEGLVTFENTRQGSVELFNMSSQSEANPFKFRLFSTDKLGHLAIQVVLKKLLYFHNSNETLESSICFEFDPTLLPKIISEFKRFFSGITRNDQRN